MAYKLFGIFLLSLVILVFTCGAGRAAEPEQVIVGMHVNDIQELDLQGHNYRLDVYVWFRWKNPAMNPAKTVEFMNAYDPADHVRTQIYDAPLKMPDGSLYNILRLQGKFSTKFPLNQYPFDRQNLVAVMEDNTYTADQLIYVMDNDTPVSLSTGIVLPGFDVEAPVMHISKFLYPTKFGDISQKEPSYYSRVALDVPVVRPTVSSTIKVFLPVMLVILCTAMVFFVHPVYIEGRLGVAITALLTLVALQLTTASSLPDVNYLLTTDKVYLLSYLFIIVTLMQIVRQSGRVNEGRHDIVLQSDRSVLKALGAFFGIGIALVLLTALCG
jgi:hypothetical protein